MADSSSALDSGGNPVVGCYYEDHKVGSVMVVALVTACTIIVVGTVVWGLLGVTGAVATRIRNTRGACVSECVRE